MGNNRYTSLTRTIQQEDNMARGKRGRKEIFDDHTPFSFEEVCAVLRFFNLPVREFNEWISGQTCPICPNGNLGIYWYDLNRYIVWKKQGTEPIFD
jgi:hypothetical protein